MPTVKPRITITFPPNLKATISRFAELQGRSFGAVVVDLLETVHDPLMRTLAILDAARDAPEEVKRGLRQAFDDVERDTVKAAGAGIAQMDWHFSRLREESPGQSGQGQPPHSNTGVRSSKKGARRASSTGLVSSPTSATGGG
jgi:hypothetical protein